jgi:hypothetical protein
MPKPPSIDEIYPRRTYDVELNDLVGWPKDQLLARLGKPDERSNGNAWPPVPAQGAEGSLNYGTLVLSGGQMVETHVFGVTPTKIQFPTLYETWTYHNVAGNTWLVYLTTEGRTTPPPIEPLPIESAAASSPGLWNKILSAFGLGSPGPAQQPSHARQGARPDLVPPRGLEPVRPLRVAEVASYPTGAVF